MSQTIYPRRSTPRGFTYIELLIVLLVIVTLTAILFPILLRMRETENRTRCARQLRSLSQAFLMYANDNKGAYPRTIHARGSVVIPTWGTGAATSDPFGPGGPAPNDVSAALFLLLRTQDITSEIFICPSSKQQKWDFGGGANTALNWSNFSNVKTQLSYSYQNPYVSEEMIKRLPFMRSYSLPHAEFARMSDMNPGVPGNSRNHRGDGQNVLYDDGHVSFATTPFAGHKQDNIFTTKSDKLARDGGPMLASPYDVDDSILLPASQ